MFNSGILDTVIGLMFVFLLVSMLVTIMNEIIAAALVSRAKWLRRGIDYLVGTKWVSEIYQHPLITGSSSLNSGSSKIGPSYIPSRSFANVLFNVVQNNVKDIKECKVALLQALDAATAAGATMDSLRNELKTMAGEMRKKNGLQKVVADDVIGFLDGSSAPNTRIWLGEVDARRRELQGAARPEFAPLLDTLAQLVSDGMLARAGIEELRTRFDAAVANLLKGPATEVLKDELVAMGKRLQGVYTVADAYADIRRFSDGISTRYIREIIEEFSKTHDDPLSKTLLTLLDDASNDIEKLKENIEVWFNNGMDRVNGWYKRRVQWVVLILAVGLTVFMNVDAILIFRHLQTYPGARDAIVAQATQFAQNTPPPSRDALIVVNGDAYNGRLQLKSPSVGQAVEIRSSVPAKAKVRTSPVNVGKDATEVPFTVDVNMGSEEKPETAVISSTLAKDEVKLTLAPSLPAQFKAVQSTIRGLAIPIGWADKVTPGALESGQILPSKEEFISGWWQLIKHHSVGWALTALAATLGAPFWFDMLNRVISIRAAGKPPGEEPKPPGSVSVPVEPGQSQQEADRLRQSDARRR